MELQSFTYHYPFILESGRILPSITLGFSTLGSLNSKKDNVIWIFHGFSMNTKFTDWWDGIVGEQKAIDPQKYFIICVNMPGSCYGSSGPLSLNPKTGNPYYKDFPFFTPLDMIHAFQLLAEHLGITKIHLGLGPSTGGMQLLQWAIEKPHFFHAIIPMAIGAKASAWMKAFNATQRMCIEADSSWGYLHEKAGEQGMRAARAVALLSYRHPLGYEIKQQDSDNNKIDAFKVDSYQRYQGEKIANRFNAYSYYTLTKTMDSYHLGRGKNSIEAALQCITARTMVMGIVEDILFPIEEQHFLAQHIQNAMFLEISSPYGHDGFLLEHQPISEGIEKILNP